MNTTNPININKKQHLVSFSLFALLFLGLIGIVPRSEAPSVIGATLKSLIMGRLIDTDPIPLKIYENLLLP